jgi:hypothetical protein
MLMRTQALATMSRGKMPKIRQSPINLCCPRCLLWLIGAGVVGLESMLENAHYLGFGAFFLLTGRGPYAVDRLLFPALDATPRLSRLAMPCLRITRSRSTTATAPTAGRPDREEAEIRDGAREHDLPYFDGQAAAHRARPPRAPTTWQAVLAKPRM